MKHRFISFTQNEDETFHELWKRAESTLDLYTQNNYDVVSHSHTIGSTLRGPQLIVTVLLQQKRK